MIDLLGLFQKRSFVLPNTCSIGVPDPSVFGGLPSKFLKYLCHSFTRSSELDAFNFEDCVLLLPVMSFISFHAAPWFELALASSTSFTFLVSSSCCIWAYAPYRTSFFALYSACRDSSSFASEYFLYASSTPALALTTLGSKFRASRLHLGACVNSRRRREEEGEKNTRYFYSLESHRQSKQTIKLLTKDNLDTLNKLIPTSKLNF